MRTALSTASREMKMDLLRTALQPLQLDYHVAPSSLRYLNYNLIYWLTLCDPEFEEAKQEFERLQAQDSDFSPREHPDFDSWVSSGAAPVSRTPLPLEELLQLDLVAKLDWLLSYSPESQSSFLDPDRHGLLQVIAQAAAKDFDWSMRLVQLLDDPSSADNDLWPAIFRGLGETAAQQ